MSTPTLKPINEILITIQSVYTIENHLMVKMNGFEDVIVTPNYRCKPRDYYTESALNFFRARHLMPFSGVSRLPVPSFLKGACLSLPQALGTKLTLKPIGTVLGNV